MNAQVSFPSPRSVAKPRSAANDRLYMMAIGVLVILGVSYNALVAMVGAAGMSITPNTVIVSEVSIVILALVLTLLRPFDADDMPSIALMVFFFIITIYMSMVNGYFYPDVMRNAALIGLFTMLGGRINLKALQAICVAVTALVLIVLLWEMYALPSYVDTFQPAQYFWKTRGLPIPYWDKSGLFSNALGFKDRFSFGVSDHRTSSLFLEQISNANFGAFLIILMVSLWNRLPVWQRVFFIATLTLIITTTSTRTSLILALFAPLGYFIYPLLPRFMNILIAPFFIFVAFAIGDPTVRGLQEDTFVGRLSLTASTLYHMDLPSALGLNVAQLVHLMDSGYTWSIYAGTIFGLLAMWTFISCYIPQVSVSQKRSAYAISLYIGSSMLVAGNACFSIKVAVLIWILAGFMRRQRDEDVVIEPGSAPAPVPEAEAPGPTPTVAPVGVGAMRILRSKPGR